ncbi:hypothetical protein RCJ22_20695 [Vibrio sp. FNV 38]|nr:hypothetical protein [Vibrio sp. FNV 38]
MVFQTLRSQTLKAQLLRMTLVLFIALVGVHHSPYLLEILAQQAMDAGCHTHESIGNHDSSNVHESSNSHDMSHHQHHHHH